MNTSGFLRGNKDVTIIVFMFVNVQVVTNTQYEVGLKICSTRVLTD